MSNCEDLQRLFPVITAAIDPTNPLRLINAIEFRNVAAGNSVFEEDQPCAGLPLILKGSIRVDKLSGNNSSLCLYQLGPGEICVISSSCLLARTKYNAQGTAESDVTLALLPTDLFNELLTKSVFRDFVFGVLADRMNELMEMVDAVAFGHLDQRLARILLGRGRIIRTTHQQIANELGCLRQVVSRLLKIFAERGWVIVTYGSIEILAPAELRGLAAG